MNKLVEKLITNIIRTFFIFYTQELNWVQNNLKKIKQNNQHRTFHLKKITVTSTKIDSSHESGKNFITWTWPASTTIIYNNHYLAREKVSLLGVFFLFPVNIFFASYVFSFY
jgi:hypothetical protein